ncbi:YopT-type cysteine protease domain-containing protein [Litoribrevibacter euphylliae]|uniref:YopT-type cysteine protease domain-containing protein n=1 Tax=Litoribrevibacter euphylliae TaxID=1834034 RepID=A0ABV7HKS9_9GAMM
MRASRFSQLARNFGVQQARVFSQKAWREEEYVWDPGKLCAGLCHAWLQEKIHGRCLLDEIEQQRHEIHYANLLDEIHRVQEHSYYPVFPEGYAPCLDDLRLFESKYGTDDWLSIQCLVNAHYQGDYVLYDLSQTYDYDKADIKQFERMPQLISWPQPPNESALLMVLRYSNQGRQRGHRFSVYFDSDARYHFFDPNAGEVIESDKQRFFCWLNAFFEEAKYSKKHALNGEPFLTLYQLHGVSAKAEMDSYLSFKVCSEISAV